MKNKTILQLCLFIWGLLHVHISYAQIILPNMIPYLKGQKWGWCDSNKIITIKPIYDSVGFFDENKLASAYIKGKCGLINQKEKYIFKPEYKKITYLNDGLYALYHANEFLLDLGNNKGKILRKDLRNVDPFMNGVSRIYKNGLYGIIDVNGKDIIADTCKSVSEQQEGMFFIRVNNKLGGIDKYKNVKIAFDTLESMEKVNNMIIYTLPHSKTSFKACMLSSGKIIIPPNIYRWIMVLKNNLIIVSLPYNSKESESICGYKSPGEIYGIMDTLGNYVIKPKYEFIAPFYNNRSLVACIDNNKYGYINYKGEEVIPIKFPFAVSEEGVTAIIYRSAGKNLYAEENKPSFYSSPSLFPAKYEDNYYFNESLVRFMREDRKFGFMDTMGVEVIAPKYDVAGTFYEGLAAVAINHKFGFIDKKGNQVVKLKYTEVGDFKDGLAPVSAKGRWFYIDCKGKEFYDQ